MINRCFLHCPGVGPITEKRLKEEDFFNWDECLKRPGDLPFKGIKRKKFLSALKKSRSALLKNDIYYFVNHFPIKEHWRILGEYFSEASFFDIETTGLRWYDNLPSVIAALHKGRFYTFVDGENIDDFLDFVSETSFLVSFNGNSFDIPFLEQTFHIPSISCPHIDLRWIAYHQGYTGGLKRIEKEFGIKRPDHLTDIDGYTAVDLYYRWQSGDKSSRKLLIEYCKADVLSTFYIASKILRSYGFDISDMDHNKIFDLINE